MGEGVPKRLPLRGADLMLLALDEASGKDGGCNNAVLALECESPLPVDRLERAMGRFLAHCPWPAARLRRPFPWGRLSWTAPRGPLTVPPVRQRRVANIGEAILGVAEEELNDRIDPWRVPAVRLVVLEGTGDGRGGLLLTFSRPLMDPHGCDTFVAQLDELDRSPGTSPWPDRPAFESPPDPRPLRERGPIARRSQGFMRSLAVSPPLSLGRGLSGRVRLKRAFLPVPAERRRRETAYRLAVVGGAVARLWRRRGLPDVPFLVPVSVDMRPKGAPGPTFGNYLSFHFARFRPSETEDLPALTARVREGIAAAVRAGSIEALWVGMEFAKYRPLSRVLDEMPWARRGGHAFSFNCADTGEFAPGLETFLGVRVTAPLHVPAVLPRPGVGVFFTRFRGREGVTVCWTEAALGDDEADEILRTVTASTHGTAT